MTNGFSGKELAASDIEGACQVFDIGAGAKRGLSATVMALGIPTKRIPRQLYRTSLIGMLVSSLSSDDMPTDATALLMMTGTSEGSIGIGALASYGYAWESDVKPAENISFSPQVSNDTYDMELRSYLANREETIYLPSDVLFGFSHWELMRSAQAILKDVKRNLRFRKPSRISVEGHTDAIGTDSYNYGLSYQRAWAVARWLMTNQVLDAGRMSVVGLAHTRPVAPDKIGNADNPAGRALNRRVEIRLHW